MNSPAAASSLPEYARAAASVRAQIAAGREKPSPTPRSLRRAWGRRTAGQLPEAPLVQREDYGQ